MAVKPGGTATATCRPKNAAGTVLTRGCTWTSRTPTVGTATSGTSDQYDYRGQVGAERLVALAQGSTRRDSIPVTVCESTTMVSLLDRANLLSVCGGPTDGNGRLSRTVPVTTMAGFTAAWPPPSPATVSTSRRAPTSSPPGAGWPRVQHHPSGTAANPIIITGAGASTVLNMNQRQPKLLASYVHLKNFRVTNMPGIGFWLEGAAFCLLDGMEIDHSNQELFKLHNASHHTIVQNSWFHDSGITAPQFGEGIDLSNSGNATNPFETTNTDNQILNNTFGPNLQGEGIDMKEGSDRTIIRGNFFDGTGATNQSAGGAGAWINVHSNNNVIDNNRMVWGKPSGVGFIAPDPSFGPMTGNL